jgi:plastocyanin
MYGLMLVEPQAGLPRVDDEFYIVQGEFYTMGPYGQQGFQTFSYQKAEAETPDYIVFNGRVGALTGNGTMKVKVGDSVRVFFGNAGPNLDSSLHIIGGIMDRVYEDGSLASPPLLEVQTVLVPAGAAAMVEFTAQTPGVLTLVDHSLFRIHQGAAATFTVTGPNNPSIISSIKNGTGPAPAVGATNVTSETETANSSSSGTQSSTNSTEVLIENFAYSPADITVPVGTTVTWVNQDSVGHTVTEGDPNSPKPANLRVFDSSGEALTSKVALIGPAQSWSYTFTTPGTYEYYCIVHPYMIGYVTVTSSSGSNASQASQYSYLTNFSITLNGRDIAALSAAGVVFLVALMLLLARHGGEQGKISTQPRSP